METVSNEHPFVVVIDGPMGSGKTTVSNLLVSKLEGTARVALADVKRFISNFEADHTYNKISQEIIVIMVGEYLKRGVNVIVEWAMKQERADSFKDIAQRYNAQFLLYRLDAPEKVLLGRVKQRTQGLLDMNELPEKNVDNIESNFEKNYKFHIENRPKDARAINAEVLAPEQIVEKILDDLK